MEEDVIGTGTALFPRSFTICAECGHVFTGGVARVESREFGDDTRSDFRELCPDCARLEEEDERSVLPEPDR